MPADHAVAERLKKEAMDSVGSATTAAMDAVNTGVATVWHNQQQLEAEARMLQQHAQQFNKQTTQVARPAPPSPLLAHHLPNPSPCPHPLTCICPTRCFSPPYGGPAPSTCCNAFSASKEAKAGLLALA